ncbi:MAG: hypothetical protein IJN56_01480 [Clostridia bacterium]|nr:hypothetical protein [Clostridia bacterium]
MVNCFSISLVLIYILISFLMLLARKERSTKKNIVFLSPIFLIVGILGVVGFSVFEIGSIIGKDVVAAAGFMAFILMSLSLIVAYFNCRLYFFDTYVIKQNFLRFKKKIDYDDFLTIKKENGTVIFRTKKTKIKISSQMVGKREFFTALKPYKNNIQDLNNVPFGKVPRVLKYKDAVYNYGEFVFGIVIFVLFEIVSLVIAFLNIFKFNNYGIAGLFAGLFLLVCLAHIATVESAKRHHSSSFWAFVAKYTYKKGYLKNPYNRKKENPWSMN